MNVLEAYEFMTQGGIVYVKNTKNTSFFGLIDEDTVRVYSDLAHYVLSLEDWKALYEEELFHAYEHQAESFIDPQKDQEYYAWTHK